MRNFFSCGCPSREACSALFALCHNYLYLLTIAQLHSVEDSNIYIQRLPLPAAKYLRCECQNYLQTGQGPLLYNQWHREHLKTSQIMTLNGPANAKSICISLSVALTLTSRAIFNESALYCSGREVGPGSILSNQTILVKNDERYFRSIVVNIQYLY